MATDIYVNVGGTWKEASNFYVNVSGTWKTGTEIYAEVSGNWKGGSLGAVGLPTTTNVLGPNFVDFALPTIGVMEAKAGINSYTLDHIDFALPTLGVR